MKFNDWLMNVFAPLFGGANQSQKGERESHMKEFCEAVLTSPALTKASLEKLSALPAVDWASLWSLMLKYGAPMVVTVLEDVIPMLPVGAVWKDLIEMVVASLAKKFGA